MTTPATTMSPTTRSTAKLYTVVDKIDGHFILLYRGVNKQKAIFTAAEAGPGAIARAHMPKPRPVTGRFA